MFKRDTPEYITLHTISCYSIIFEPYQSSQIYVAKTKQRMADTHLSIETTYIAYPICYTMMLPNMPFRKADAHPLRLNTRCKDLTLVPSIYHNDIFHGDSTISPYWYVQLFIMVIIVQLFSKSSGPKPGCSNSVTRAAERRCSSSQRPDLNECHCMSLPQASKRRHRKFKSDQLR